MEAFRMTDLLAKKRHGGKLSAGEISFFVKGYTAGLIPDYQASALTMAICMAGMDAEETLALTMEMMNSGDVAELSEIPGIKVDKHSTGGVGDKTTLIVAPIVASLGIPVAKMSGRGLGHTGGTVDKLESFPGFRSALSREEFLNCVKTAGIAVAGQSGNLAPADKKLYALRDATATVDSIPLIASSIMSKKLASGADAIVLDVKTGSGAFLKTLEDARLLAREMVMIGEGAGRATVALLTNMDSPLGCAIGNALEVREAIEVLRGNGPADLTGLCIELAANMLVLAGAGDLSPCRGMAEEALRNGTALSKLTDLIRAQSGDFTCVEHPDKLPSAPFTEGFPAPESGYIVSMDAERIGVASMILGAGRTEKDGAVDHGAGIILLKKPGDHLDRGETAAFLHTSDPESFTEACEILRQAIKTSVMPPKPEPVIYGRIYMRGGEIVEETPADL